MFYIIHCKFIGLCYLHENTLSVCPSVDISVFSCSISVSLALVAIMSHADVSSWTVRQLRTWLRENAPETPLGGDKLRRWPK